jgi:hypothetical protein
VDKGLDKGLDRGVRGGLAPRAPVSRNRERGFVVWQTRPAVTFPTANVERVPRIEAGIERAAITHVIESAKQSTIVKISIRY